MDSQGNTDFDLATVPVHWKRAMKQAGIRKADLKDSQTREMIFSMLRSAEDTGELYSFTVSWIERKKLEGEHQVQNESSNEYLEISSSLSTSQVDTTEVTDLGSTKQSRPSKKEATGSRFATLRERSKSNIETTMVKMQRSRSEEELAALSERLEPTPLCANTRVPTPFPLSESTDSPKKEKNTIWPSPRRNSTIGGRSPTSKEKEKEKIKDKEKDISKTSTVRHTLKRMLTGASLLTKARSSSKPAKVEDKIADHLLDLQRDQKSNVLLSTIFTEIEKLDTWSSKERSTRKWTDVPQSEIHESVGKIFDRTCEKQAYHIEYGSPSVVLNPKNNIIEDADGDVPYYKNCFFGKAQVNLLCDGSEDATVGPICISFELMPSGKDDEKKALLRSKKGNTRFLIPSTYSGSTKDMLKYTKMLYPELSPLKFTEIGYDQDLIQKLVDYEAKNITYAYKFGVLYVKEGQTDEDEMFSNNDTSPDYEEFLEFLGDNITLKGWTGFRGGLDVKTDTTGIRSVFTKFRDGFEIMFHVSTMLPFQPDDKQRVERKRHLGNDIIMLIFKEGDQPFDPLCIKSQFIHIFAVVQVHAKIDGKTYYKLSIANRTGVGPYGPFIPFPPIFEKNDQFRDFLLTKLINAERAGMQSPDFKGKMVRTARDWLADVAKEFIPKARKIKKNEYSLSMPNIITTPSSSSELYVSDGDISLRPRSASSNRERIQSRPNTPTSPLGFESLSFSNSGLDSPSEDSIVQMALENFEWMMKKSKEQLDITITVPEKEQSLKLFQSLDTDKDGLLTGVQAAQVFIKSGISKDELTKIWGLSDMNADKHLNSEEFAISMYLIQQRRLGNPLPDELPASLKPSNRKWNLSRERRDKLQQEFEKIDTDNDGILSAKDAAMPFLSHINSHELAKICMLADINCDKMFHFDEFVLVNMLAEAKQEGAVVPGHLPYELIELSKSLREPQEVMYMITILEALPGNEDTVKGLIENIYSNSNSSSASHQVFQIKDDPNRFVVHQNFSTASAHQMWKEKTSTQRKALEKLVEQPIAPSQIMKITT